MGMNARVIQAVIFEATDTGSIFNIAFSNEGVQICLNVLKAYASQNDGYGLKNIDRMCELASKASLPDNMTPADSHYGWVSAITQSLEAIGRNLLNNNPQKILDFETSPIPRIALCFVVNGPQGLQIAFSKEAAKQWYDQKVPSIATINERETEIAITHINQTKFPIPETEVFLDKKVRKPPSGGH